MHCSQLPDQLSGQPDVANMKVGVNARLVDDFDLASPPVKTIDRRNMRRFSHRKPDARTSGPARLTMAWRLNNFACAPN
jgi:hypothetical protein